MVKFTAVALRWVSKDPQPGLIEVSIQDASGHEHRIVEKTAVLSTSPVDENTLFPFELSIDAESEVESPDTVVVKLPYNIETTQGQTRVTISRRSIPL